MTSAPPPSPGWYTDNTQPNTERWHDGSQWTQQTRPIQGGTMVADPPRKRKKPLYKRVWFWLLLILVLIIVLIVVVVSSISSAVNTATNNPHTVIYKISGNGKTADVTYLNINGDGTSGQEQDSKAALPFTKTVTGKGDFSEYSLTAQAAQGATNISCSITVDGKVKATQTSKGEFAVVSCTASGS